MLLTGNQVGTRRDGCTPTVQRFVGRLGLESEAPMSNGGFKPTPGLSTNLSGPGVKSGEGRNRPLPFWAFGYLYFDW